MKPWEIEFYKIDGTGSQEKPRKINAVETRNAGIKPPMGYVVVEICIYDYTRKMTFYCRREKK